MYYLKQLFMPRLKGIIIKQRVHVKHHRQPEAAVTTLGACVL